MVHQDIRMAERIIKPEPETSEVLIVSGVLSNSRDFEFIVSSERGDVLSLTDELISFTSGTSGEVVEVQRAHVSLLSRVTRKVLKTPASDRSEGDLHTLNSPSRKID
jgi:hypothetical protein